MNDWFKIAMETPDDGAGGGADPGEGGGDEGHQSVFTESGWAAALAAAEAPDPAENDDADPDPAADPAPAPAAAAAPALPEGWDQADWEQFQREYPGRTPAQLWHEHKNLRSAFSRGEHNNPPPAPVTEEPKPPTWRSDDYSALGEIPQDGLTNVQREQLGGLMQADPKAAAHWAAANSHLLTEQEFAAVQSNWYQADPYGATQAWNRAEQMREQERMEAEYGPRLEVVDTAQQLQGIALAEQAIPDFGAHKADFAQWIEANPEIDEYLVTLKSPEEVRDQLTVLYYQWYGPNLAERVRAQEAQAAEAAATAAAEATAAAAAAETANRRARTATRTAPAPSPGGEASSEDIRAAIMAARR